MSVAEKEIQSRLQEARVKIESAHLKKKQYTVSLLDSKTLKIHPSTDACFDFFTNVSNAEYNIDNNSWVFGVEHFPLLVESMKNSLFIGPPLALLSEIGKFAIKESQELSCSVVTTLHNRKTGKSTSLYPYQVEGVRKIKKHNYKLLLADDMGLGKTIQAIAAVLTCMEEKKAWIEGKGLLIIATPTLVKMWKEEAKSYFTDVICTVAEYQRKPAAPQSVKRVRVGREKDIFVLIDTYDRVSGSIRELDASEFFMAVLDESSSLKTPTSQRSVALVPFLQKLQHVLLLSGTPSSSRPIELLTTLQIVCPALYTQNEYLERYCRVPDSRLSSIKNYAQRERAKYSGQRNLDELKTVLDALVWIRRDKKSCLALGIKERYRVSFVSPVGPAVVKRGKESPKEMFLEYSEVSIQKIEPAIKYIEALRECGRKKIVVFGYHVVLLECIHRHFSEQSILVDGSVAEKRRSELISQFQTAPEIEIAVLSIATCSQGINLVCARDVVFAELYWNFTDLEQAEDRIYRNGQKENVEIHYLIISRVDETILSLLQRKVQMQHRIGAAKKREIEFIERQFDPGQTQISKYFKAPQSCQGDENV